MDLSVCINSDLAEGLGVVKRNPERTGTDLASVSGQLGEEDPVDEIN